MENFNLPKDHRPYIDKYFLRAKEILEKEGLNPIVKVQVFIRRGNCKVYGINEAIAIIMNYAPNNKTIKIKALKEGDHFAPGETLMVIEAPIQEIIDLETMYLGVLSSETTVKNGGAELDFGSIERNMARIVKLAGKRPVSYFGARHWGYDSDKSISEACFNGGAKECSTDAGAGIVGKEGIGTIPHSLETIYHWKTDITGAVFHATAAFDEHMDKAIPRIALVDYGNREILDSIDVAEIVDAIRIDTCGENRMQGVMVLDSDMDYSKFSRDTGVSIHGVYLVRKIMDDAGHNKVKIILSSGFGNPEKVEAFVDAEKELGIRLFDYLGVGGVFESRMATADIIEVGGREIHKVGRNPKPNKRLRRIV